jgi:hypothetical protein
MSMFKKVWQWLVGAALPTPTPFASWSITPVITTDYAPSWGELVRINMAGKIAPESVTIKLPPSDKTSVGKCISVVTTNQGGAEDGSSIRITSSNGQTIGGVPNEWAPSTGEHRLVFVSDGQNVQVLSIT